MVCEHRSFIVMIEREIINIVFVEPLFRLTPKDLNLPTNSHEQTATSSSSSGKVSYLLFC